MSYMIGRGQAFVAGPCTAVAALLPPASPSPGGLAGMLATFRKSELSETKKEAALDLHSFEADSRANLPASCKRGVLVLGVKARPN
jgi:hypothetical protein